jgi:exodeoxyribonuclease V alpha subunit
VNIPPPLAPQEELSGLIERVTFHSEETGFGVLRVKVKGRRELVTVAGALASVKYARRGKSIDCVSYYNIS